MLALAGTPVYLLARRLLGGIWLPTLFVACYFLMPTVTEVAYDAFYPIIWAALPISFASYFLLTDRTKQGVALALLAIPIEEEAGLAVLGLGLMLLLRRGQRRVGLALALITRLALLASIAWIIGLTRPVFDLLGQSVSWRDIVLVGGGFFLLYKGTREIHHRFEQDDLEQVAAA